MVTTAHSQGTRASYGSGIKQYESFCSFIGENVYNFTDLRNKFLLFLLFLQQEKKLGFETIKVYAAAVRFWFVANGCSDPGIASGGDREPLLRLLFLGIQRASVGKCSTGRKPITTKRLIRFVGAVDKLGLSKLENIRLRALMLLAFWGMFRGSELCTKYGETKFLRHRDVVVGATGSGHRYVRITLQKNKN